MTNSAYKIMAGNGQFSTGGMYPSFSDTGKAWASRRALNLHLASLGKFGRETYTVANVIVLEANFVDETFNRYTLEDWEYITVARRMAREIERESWRAAQQAHIDQGAGI